MLSIDLVRVWKDEEYRLSLDLQQLARLPKNPAGEIEVQDEDLEQLHSTLGMTVSIPVGCPPTLPR